MTDHDEPGGEAGESQISGAGDHGGRALVIGIDDYPHFEAAPLKGCRNDAEWIAALLTERFGFAASRVRLLLDREATREGILGALDDLAGSLAVDEPVVVHYSGHGSQVIAGGVLCETLVPHDSGRGANPVRDVVDFEIHQRLVELTRISGAVTLIFDSCHSGSISRHHAGERWVAPELRPGAWLGHGSPPVRSASRRRGPSGWLPESGRYTLLAACRAEESACELWDAESARHHGAFTFHLARALIEEARPGATYRDLFERAAARVTLYRPTQHPQLEGVWDRELFGTGRLIPAAHVPVRERQGAEVRLGAGAAHGLVAGSEWSVYPSGTSEPPGATPCGRIRIVRLGPAGAAAEILDEASDGAVAAGTRAFEVARPAPAFRFRVRLAGRSPAVEELAGRLADSPLIAVARDGDDEACQVAVHRLSADSAEVSESAPAPGPGALATATWTVLDAAGGACAPPVPATDPAALDRVARNLEALARQRALFELRHPCPERDVLRPLLEIELVHWAGGRRVESRAVPLELCAGDGLGVTVCHRHDRPLHVAVLDLGLTGSVSLLYPVRGAVEPLAPGDVLRLGATAERALRVSIPEPPAAAQPAVRYCETLVVFASASEADFGLLAQPGTRLAAPGRPSPALARYLGRAVPGVAERSQAPAVEVAEPEPWTVVHRSFVVRRREET